MKKIILSFVFLLGMVTPSFGAEKIKVGVLPAGDSILLHVAHDEKIFSEQGLDVEIIPFQSALELNTAVRSGAVDAFFTDIINATIMHCTGKPQTIIATTSYARNTQRHFGLILSPKSSVTDINSLQNMSVAIGKDTIVDFLLTQFLASQNKSDTFVTRQDIRAIPVRLQLLMAGQVDSALLPEPLVSTLEARGAKVLLDDRNLKMPLAVISFSQNVLNKEIYNSFRKALAISANKINENPEKYKQTMVEKKLLSSDALTKYKMLSFDKDKTVLYIPSAEEFMLYFTWLKERNVIKDIPNVESIIPHFN